MAPVLRLYSQETSSILPTRVRAAVSKPGFVWVYSLWPQKLLILFFMGVQIHLEGGVAHRLVVKPVSERDGRCEIGVINAPRQRKGPRNATVGHFCEKGVMVPPHDLSGISNL